MQEAMSNTQSTEGGGAQPFGFLTGTRLPIPTGGPVLSIDLAGALRLMQHEQRWSGNRNAMILIKHRDLRLVLSALRAGARLAQHNVRGTVLLQVLKGKIRVGFLDAVLEASAGEVVSLDANLGHEVKALEDAVLLIAIAWPEGSRLTPATPPSQAEDPFWDWRADESVWN